ncbi:MAG: hypothetical protein ACOXZR_01000 [Bacilli bacterium]
MKIKKTIIIFLLFILPVIIYIINIDKKIYLLSLGDALALGQNSFGIKGYGYSDYVNDYLEGKNILEFYSKGFAEKDYRTIDLIRDIEDNKKLKIDDKEITIKNALTNADVIMLSIGINDLLYKLNIDNKGILISEKEIIKYVDEIIIDLEKLLILLKRYCNEDIIIIGYYNPFWFQDKEYAEIVEPIFKYFNFEIKKLSDKNKLFFIDIYNNFYQNDEYLPNCYSIYPSNSGYKFIAKKIIKILEENILD